MNRSRLIYVENIHFSVEEIECLQMLFKCELKILSVNGHFKGSEGVLGWLS